MSKAEKPDFLWGFMDSSRKTKMDFVPTYTDDGFSVWDDELSL